MEIKFIGLRITSLRVFILKCHMFYLMNMKISIGIYLSLLEISVLKTGFFKIFY